MSKNFKGYMGDQIGKLGTAVGRKWLRKMIYSAYQGKVRNPKTIEQCKVRAHFALMGSMAVSFLDATEIGLKQRANRKGMTPSDYFVKKNWDAVTVIDPETLTVDFGALVVSEGRTPWVEFGTPSFAEEGEVSVTFDASTDVKNASPDDKVYVFIYQPDMDMGVLSTPTTRSAETITVPVPKFWSGLEVHLYGFAVGVTPQTKGNPSPSVYIGYGTIA